MKRTLAILVATALVALGASALALGADSATSTWFGSGGPMVGLLLPNLQEVNAFLGDAGFGEIEGPVLAVGGGGRGGVVGGLSFGGLGWGGELRSRLLDKTTSLSYGFGGFDLGYVVGGSDRSFLTLGAVLGGGGMQVEIRESPLGEESLAASASSPSGIVITPEGLTFGRAFIGLLPYVSMEIHPFDWIGFTVHFGYLLPVVPFDWSTQEGITVPAVDPSGLFVGFSLSFGGVARGRGEESAANQTSQSTIALGTTTALLIKNKVGNVTIASEAGAMNQTSSSRSVELIAIKHASRQDVLNQISVDIAETEAGVEVSSRGPQGLTGAWSVDYFVKVPAGLDITVEQSVGDVALTDLSGSLSVEAAAWKKQAERMAGAQASVDVGAGDVALLDLRSQTTVVSSGAGSIELTLRPDASATLAASTGIGGISVGQFPGMQLTLRGFLGHQADAVLGAGAASVTAKVGVGEIRVHPVTP